VNHIYIKNYARFNEQRFTRRADIYQNITSIPRCLANLKLVRLTKVFLRGSMLKIDYDRKNSNDDGYLCRGEIILRGWEKSILLRSNAVFFFD
jgi:hypothetical protein